MSTPRIDGRSRRDYLGLGSRVTRRLLLWSLVIGSVSSLIFSALESYHAYDERVAHIRHDLTLTAAFVAPTLTKSLWAFDEEQVETQLRGIRSLPEIQSVRLKQPGRPDRHFGVESAPDAIVEHLLPLTFDQDGRHHGLGTLVLTADLRAERTRMLWQALANLGGNAVVILLVVLSTVALYHEVVRRRLKIIAAETHAITPNDLRSFGQSRAPAAPGAMGDELDELATAIVSLKLTASRALHEADDREAQLRALSDSLAESKQLLQVIVDTVPIRVFWKDRDLRYAGCNPAFARDAGKQSPADVVGRDDHQLGWAENAESYRADDLHVITSGVGKLSYEEQQRTPSGKVIWLRTSKVPLRSGRGDIVGVLGTYDDITATKRAAEELERHRHHLEQLVDERTGQLVEAKEAAEAANRAKSAFLANMSHEIRNPLNAIVGMAQLIRRGGLAPRQSHQLERLMTASHHLLNIINAILELSKIDAGKLSLEQAHLKIEAVLSNVTSLLQERAAARQLTLVTEIAPIPWALLGDATRLQQALLNYAGNAIKFSECGEVLLRTTLVEDADDSVLLRFEVRDHGIGIAADVIPRLFAAFEQADNSTTRRYGGTGLGLAITRRLAEMMGGQVGVESSPGAGSTFWFTARLRKVAATDAPAPDTVATSAEAAIRSRFSGDRVLVVEDDPINLEVALATLEPTGLVVESASDGETAVRMAAARSYALVLMDVQMPTLDGLRATTQLRKLAGYARTPIVAMTANAFDEDRARCLQAGMDDFVSKPVDPQALFRTLLHWLARATTQDRAHRRDDALDSMPERALPAA